jgi:hypothetical protein
MVSMLSERNTLEVRYSWFSSPVHPVAKNEVDGGSSSTIVLCIHVEQMRLGGYSVEVIAKEGTAMRPRHFGPILPLTIWIIVLLVFFLVGCVCLVLNQLHIIVEQGYRI